MFSSFKYNGQDTYLTQSLKIGVWQNNKPSGFTLFVGFQTNSIVRYGAKTIDDKLENLFYSELGYKMHLSDKIFIHGYTGFNKIRLYTGIGSYYEITDDLLLGVFYKDKIVGTSVLFTF